MNFKKYSQDFLRDMKHRWTASTFSSYSDRINAALPFIGDDELCDIKPRTLHKLAGALTEVQKKSGEKLSERRINSIMSIVVSVLNDAYENDEGPTKPFSWAKVKIEKDQKGNKIDPLPPEEVKKVISKIDPHYQPIFWFLYCTGCRPSEALALRWGEVDLDSTQPQVTFCRSKVRGVEGTTKTKQTRSVRLNRRARNVLNLLPRGEQNESVFKSKRGEPLNGHLDRIWREAVREAKIKHRPSYRLRHSFGSAALYNGVAVPVVSKMLGHSSIKTTLRFYADTMESMPTGEDKIEDMFA